MLNYLGALVDAALCELGLFAPEVVVAVKLGNRLAVGAQQRNALVVELERRVISYADISADGPSVVLVMVATLGVARNVSVS